MKIRHRNHNYHNNAWPFHFHHEAAAAPERPLDATTSKEQAAISSVVTDQQLEEALSGLSSRYQLEPFSWKELQQIVKERDFDSLCRSKLQQTEYTRFRRELRVEWKSLEDYLLVSTFHFEERTNPDTKLKYAHPSLQEYKKQSQKEKHLELSPNKFQYFVPEDVVHMVLWKLGGGPCNEEEIADAKEQIQAQQGEKGCEVAEFLCWTNPPQNKSVPDIEHCQMLCLTKKKGGQAAAVKLGSDCVIL